MGVWWAYEWTRCRKQWLWLEGLGRVTRHTHQKEKKTWREKAKRTKHKQLTMNSRIFIVPQLFLVAFLSFLFSRFNELHGDTGYVKAQAGTQSQTSQPRSWNSGLTQDRGFQGQRLWGACTHSPGRLASLLFTGISAHNRTGAIFRFLPPKTSFIYDT